MPAAGEPKEIVTGSGIRSGSQRSCMGLKTLDVARSMCTGMIGTSRPLTMRSMPRWNGLVMPVRVIWPSGKMQTSSPLSRALPASRKASRIIRGPARGGDRDRPHGAEEPAQERPLEVLGVDHEADRPVDRGDHEQAVGEGHVVRGQQARAPRWARWAGPATRNR